MYTRWAGQRLLAWCSVLLWAPESNAQPCTPRWTSRFTGDGRVATTVNALLEFEGDLYVGGSFDSIMNRDLLYVVRLSGARWSPFGAGLGHPIYEAYCHAFASFGDPPKFFAASEIGVFRRPDDPNMPIDPNDPNGWWPRIAATDGPVRALAVYQGMLYAGGEFTCIRPADPNDPNALCDPNTPGHVAGPIARWDGQTWSAVGGGVGPDPNDANSPAPSVLALTVFEDDGGEALFVGGTFLTAGGVSTNRIARW